MKEPILKILKISHRSVTWAHVKKVNCIKQITKKKASCMKKIVG